VVVLVDLEKSEVRRQREPRRRRRAE